MDSEKTRSSKDRVTPYEKPYVDVIGFTYQDIIRTSGEICGGMTNDYGCPIRND